MTVNRQELQKLKGQQQDFTALAEMCSRDELVKCTRFLAMYIVLYRQEFGDVPSEGYRKLLEAETLDDELLTISMEGMREAAAMMKIILMQNRKPADGGNENIQLN